VPVLQALTGYAWVLGAVIGGVAYMALTKRP
jgi:cytosine/uracil/thiamine/allantoin permease